MSDAVIITIIICGTVFITSCAVAGIITGTNKYWEDGKKKSVK